MEDSHQFHALDISSIVEAVRKIETGG